MNVDECFFNNNLKVFTIIVSFFNDESCKSLVQHYHSKIFNVVNAVNLANFVFECFKEDEIPHENLVSNLVIVPTILEKKEEDSRRCSVIKFLIC